MPQIRPVSELRNNFADISRIVHAQKEPVFLTKNGYGDMVVMSVEQFDTLTNSRRIDTALQDAERQALSGVKLLDFDTVTATLRGKLADMVGVADA